LLPNWLDNTIKILAKISILSRGCTRWVHRRQLVIFWIYFSK